LVTGTRLVIALFAQLAVAVEARGARGAVVFVLRLAGGSGGLLAVRARARVLHALEVV